ncbi:uncharacterized protein B0H18DRAFT_1087640 [Fomitopsis serialis]|uniref:uncharacterized protein n=1 Tax=Fomitopsis serialis TaxID=139415 RepID=UPI002008A7C0|nr:uncharacterized protein B0H18DRAFT_1087640 [Neoantrodia serialis]KAH9915115.1 hypothetical protein B0H18DRAFT_1087640 [Neoantrodia serialis]
MSMSRSQLLQLAIPLVHTYGFTRAALSHSVFRLPKPHSEQLSDSAVTALFGEDHDARKTLITAWLENARYQMKGAPSPTIRDVLAQRLKLNEPVLQFLPEALALMASPTSGLPPLDPVPALKHTGSVADEACTFTAYDFLGNLLNSSAKVESALTDAGVFAQYIGRSWAGIIKSRGMI